MKKKLIELSLPVQTALEFIMEAINLSRLQSSWLSDEHPLLATIRGLNFLEGLWCLPDIFDEINPGKTITTYPENKSKACGTVYAIETRTISFSRDLHGSQVKLWVIIDREEVDTDLGACWFQWTVQELIIRDNEGKPHRFTEWDLNLEKLKIQCILDSALEPAHA